MRVKYGSNYVLVRQIMGRVKRRAICMCWDTAVLHSMPHINEMQSIVINPNKYHLTLIGEKRMHGLLNYLLCNY